MIILALLIGGALFLAAFAIFGQTFTVALGAVCVVLSCIGIGADQLYYRRDRRKAYRRWREWKRG